jgi:hypothetical protein
MDEKAPERLSEKAALAKVRELAFDSAKIVVLPHGRKRQRSRVISFRQIQLCCQRGTITEGPFLNQHGAWQLNLYRHAAGEEITCVVAIDWPSRLLVVTVIRGRH